VRSRMVIWNLGCADAICNSLMTLIARFCPDAAPNWTRAASQAFLGEMSTSFRVFPSLLPPAARGALSVFASLPEMKSPPSCSLELELDEGQRSRCSAFTAQGQALPKVEATSAPLRSEKLSAPLIIPLRKERLRAGSCRRSASELLNVQYVDTLRINVTWM